MKKILFAMAFFAATSTNVMNAANPEVMSANDTYATMSACACGDECYKGTLDNLVMNGKDGYDPVTDQCIHLTTTNGAGKLTCTVKQIGSMPGVVKLDMDVNVSNGVITVTNTTEVGGLYIGSLQATPFKLTSFSGTVLADGTVEINCAVAGRYSGLFPASFHFSGSACDGVNCECE